MNTKIRIKFDVTIEYDADPAHYPEDKRTPEGMLEVDLANANEDPFLYFTQGAEWKISGEVVQEPDEDPA